MWNMPKYDVLMTPRRLTSIVSPDGSSSSPVSALKESVVR